MRGIILDRQQMYANGWSDMLRIPPLRAIGGLALAISTMGIVLEDAGAWPENGPEDDRMAALLNTIPEQRRPSADQAMEVLTLALHIDTEEAWAMIVGIGLAEMVVAMLTVAACCFVKTCELEHLEVDANLNSFWESMAAPIQPTQDDAVPSA